MSDDIKLIVGLGNPGSKYLNTRHNFGFKALDILVNDGNQWKNWNGMASVISYNRDNKKVLLAKPITFMNNSGFPIRNICNFYKFKPQEVLVIYDDFAIALGSLKFRLNGSSGGHNGIESIIENLGSDKFPRIKLGTGPLPKHISMPDFVLSKFSNSDLEKVNTVLSSINDIINNIIDLGFEKAVSKIKL